jgi:acyl-CoA thioester hydrolase
MPLTHERKFRVRHYECDLYGHLNNTNYLRYMQETAFDASTAAGYDTARYQSMDRTWWIRETDIEYFQPVRYNDQITIKTWVLDFWRVHSRRVYEFYRVETGELVARAVTDWGFLKQSTGQPAPIPEALMTAFFPDGDPAVGSRRKRIPAPPRPPAGAFSHPRRVAWRDLDANAHVNNAAYLEFAEDCGVEVAAAYEWPMARCMDAGFAILVRRHQILYRRPATLGDDLEVKTWISDVRRVQAIRHYTITQVETSQQLARLRSTYVWVDLSSGKPIRIPEVFLRDFEANIVHDARTALPTDKPRKD